MQINSCNFVRMGKRKLRFFVRKNYERKKYGWPKLTTSYQRKHVKIVSLPISAIKAAVVSSISVLHRMLLILRVLPTSWICSLLGSSLALYQLDMASSTMSAATTTMLTIGSDFTWALRIGEREIHASECMLICCASWQLLNSVDKVVSLVTTLGKSKFCIGNPEGKYGDLIERHKGVFRNQTGKL